MEKTISSRLIHRGRSFAFKSDVVKLTNGVVTVRDVVEHPGGVSILPILNDGRVVLVRQYRYSTHRMLLELPAGTLESGERPSECARRELLEETGYSAGELREILGFYLAPGYSSEKMYLFVATALSKVGSQMEDDEEIDVVRVDLARALDMVRENIIEDCKTIAGLLFYLESVRNDSP